MRLKPNEFWAVVYEANGERIVVADDEGVPYMYGKKSACEIACRELATLMHPLVGRVAKVRVEAAR